MTFEVRKMGTVLMITVAFLFMAIHYVLQDHKIYLSIFSF